LLANKVGWLAVWFAKLGNGLAELRNQLVTLKICPAIWFAWLVN